jgi:hypothetical protein
MVANDRINIHDPQAPENHPNYQPIISLKNYTQVGLW